MELALDHIRRQLEVAEAVRMANSMLEAYNDWHGTMVRALQPLDREG